MAIALEMTVEAVEALGHSTFLYGAIPGASEFRAKLDGHHVVTGEVMLYADPARVLVFGADGAAVG